MKPVQIVLILLVGGLFGYGMYQALQTTGDAPDHQQFVETPSPHYINLWQNSDELELQFLEEGFPIEPPDARYRYLTDGEPDGEFTGLDQRKSTSNDRYRLTPPDTATAIELRYPLEGTQNQTRVELPASNNPP